MLKSLDNRGQGDKPNDDRVDPVHHSALSNLGGNPIRANGIVHAKKTIAEVEKLQARQLVARHANFFFGGWVAFCELET